MTPEQQAAEKIKQHPYVMVGYEETEADIATIIRETAIKPAVDEATRKLKEALQELVASSKRVEFIITHFQDPCKVEALRQSITAAEKLLEK